MGKTAHTKADGRTRDARRLKALSLQIGEPEIQFALAKILASCLALEVEKLEHAQRTGTQIDGDATVRLANAFQRSLESVRELTPKKAYWESPEQIAEREEREAFLSALTEGEILGLRAQIPGAPPLPAPPPVYVPAPTLTQEEQAARNRIEDERTRMQGQSVVVTTKNNSAKKKKRTGPASLEEMLASGITL